MPQDKHLKIIIGVDGRCSVDAINFIGPSCRQATQEVANALGVQIEQRDKPEVRLRERTRESERAGAR